MQSDDLFVRKFCRQSPRPALTAMSFEPRRDPCLRSQVKPEWPPRREEEEVMLGESPPPSQAGPGLRSPGRSHIVQRSNSEVILGDLEASGTAYGARAKAPGMGSLGPRDSPSPLLHRDYGSLSSLERGSCARMEDSEEQTAQSPAALRFKDPLVLLGLQGADIEPDGFSRALDVPDGEPLRQAKVPKQDAQNKKGKSSPTLAPRACHAHSLPGATWVHNFAHYDVQSILFDLTEAASSHDSIGRKKNITSGASAASHVQPSASGAVSQLVGGVGGDGGAAEDPEGQRQMSLPLDEGDGNDNDMLLSCPHFRNETGGEDRPGGLGRVCGAGAPWLSLQAPNDAVSILEEPRESHIQQQPKTSYFIEHADLGAHYYRKYFYMKDHQNFFGVDDRLGPVAISFRREEKEGSSGAQYNYRIIFRTTELKTLRGSVAEESVSTGTRHTPPRGLPHRRLLEHILPELNLHCLRLASNSPKVPEILLTLDEQRLNFQRKVGVMYCRANQNSEEDMYNNEYAGPAFEEFLDLLGQKVRLQGFDKFRAQLDNKTDSTGTHSLYTKYQDYEIMFHVSTMLPYTPSNTQQLLRKRHIGNDIVTIVFQEPGALAFTPKTIRSHFQHVFIIVQVHHPCTEKTYYRVAVTRSRDIPLFGPFFPKGARFPRSPAFRDFLLAKAVNAENAAEKSEKFLSMATRTRQGYLKDLAENFVTTSPIDSSKFPLLSRVKRKEKPKSTRGAELQSAGALVWPVMASEGGTGAEKLPCLLVISGESVVLIESSSRLVVFNCNSRDVIGWKAVTEGGASGGPYLDIYYERGESISISVSESQVEDIREVVQRLKRVSGACEVREVMPLRDSVGHPGFMLSEDGFVVELQQSSYTESAGLQMGARVVRLCGRPLVALPAAERASLLRSAPRIHLTVIPPDRNGKQARSLSELYQKALQGTELKPGDSQSREAWVVEEKEEQEEPRGQEAQEHWHSGVRDQRSLVSPPCPPVQRATSFQDDSASRSPPTGSYMQETPQLQPNPCGDRHIYDNRVQRRKMHIYEVPVEVQTTTPDLIPKAVVEEKEDLRQQQALTSPCRTPEVAAPPPSEPVAPLDNTDYGSSAQNMQNSLNKILLEPSDSPDDEWQSITAVASACNSMLEAMRHEGRRAVGDVAQAPGDGPVIDGQVDSIMNNSVESNFPGDLGEKVSQLENILKRLQADLQKEKEDKAELQAEVLSLRENNQRLREESQSTVARLIKVTELLCRTTKH